MLIHNEFPRPENQLQVLKRYLHVLALLQNKNDKTKWNYSTLGTMLEHDEGDKQVSDKMIRDYLQNNLQKDLGIDIDTGKGRRKAKLGSAIDKNLYPMLANVYSLFVASDVSRENTLRRYLKAHGDEALWLLARIYFASKTGTAVRFQYMSRSEKKLKKYTVKPYHLVFRGNNLYLACGNLETGKDVLFILSKIKPGSFELTDLLFDPDKTPTVNDLFASSLGAFIGKKQKIVLRYTKNVASYITDIIDSVDPKIKQITGSGPFDFEASFEIADDLYLCKQLFSCGAEAEIVSPASARKLMKEKLEACLRVYG